MHEYKVLIVALGIFCVIIYRFVILVWIDKSTIRTEVEGNGHKIIEISWNPFGSGWFGEKGERQYAVIYCNSNGDIVRGECKTSIFTGVYWKKNSPDRIRSNRNFAKTEMINCTQCNSPMQINAKFCSECGSKSIME